MGVDVPDATTMIIYNAERFGLSQLHQLRGRVGRGDKKSYCFLLPGADTEEAAARLSVIKNSSDGFEIAEADLKLRGGGDFTLSFILPCRRAIFTDGIFARSSS